METKPNTDNVYEEILNLFVGKRGDCNEWMEKPFTDLSKVMATNKISFVAVPKERVETHHIELIGKTKGVYPCLHTCEKEITLHRLQEAMKQVPLVDELDNHKAYKCKECNGFGQVEWQYGNYTDEDDCPKCNGDGEFKTDRKPTGKKVYDPSKVIIIGDSKFNVLELELLKKTIELLKQDKFSLVNQTQPKQASLFKIEDVEILMMPFLPDGNVDLVAATIKI